MDAPPQASHEPPGLRIEQPNLSHYLAAEDAKRLYQGLSPNSLSHITESARPADSSLVPLAVSSKQDSVATTIIN